MELKVRNVNAALSEALWLLKRGSYPIEESRNGKVIAFDEPVITTYFHPEERVLFSNARDCNPVFHLMECIWILAGRRDVEFLSNFNSTINQYSDDSVNFNAAYGYRLREHFSQDQLVEAIYLLRKDPATRQAVLQIWDAADLSKNTKDKACNLCVIFDCRGRRLNMTVYNRSNDLWWGAYGANAVHFSFLQELVASAVYLPIGSYRQISNNLHLYLGTYDGSNILADPSKFEHSDYYSDGQVRYEPIMEGGDYVSFLNDCSHFCNDPFNGNSKYNNAFFSNVAYPMAMVSRARKIGEGDGSYWANKISAPDWKRAAQDWVHRRNVKKQSSVKS